MYVATNSDSVLISYGLGKKHSANLLRDAIFMQYPSHHDTEI